MKHYPVILSRLNLPGLRQGITRSVRRLLLFVVLLLVAALSPIVGCSEAPLPPLRIATNLWPGYETLHLAQHLGYYKNTPIEILNFPSGSEQVRAFRNGNIEGAGISLDQALVLATTNPDVRIVAVMDFSEGGDVILARPEIPNLPALKGKRVGVEANALGAYIITRALEIAGLTTQDIKIVSLGLSEHERAYKDGVVDAVVTFGPARSKLLSIGAKQLFSSSQIPGEIVDVLIVRESIITRYPELAKALVQGRFQALEYLNKNPKDALARLAPRTQVTPEQLAISLKGLRSPNLQENRELLSQRNPSLLQSTRRLITVMVENRLLTRVLDPTPLLDDQLVNQVGFPS